MPTADLIVLPRPGKSGTPAELENAVVNSIEWKLNAVELMEYWLPVRDPKISKPLVLENETQAWIDGTLEWQGYVHKAVSNPAGTTFFCESLLGYFAGRHVLTPLNYTQVEQRTIAWNLINYAQTGTDMGLGITSATFSGTTKLRDRPYGTEAKQNILDALLSFTRLIDGFDFEIKAYGDGRREYTPYHPSRGTARTALALEWGRNLDSFTYVEEALPGRFANRSIVTGPVVNEARLEADNRDATSATKHGEFQVVLSDGAIDSTQQWITDRAAEETAQRKNLFAGVDLDAVEVPVKLLGVVRPGDTLPIRILSGRVNESLTLRVHSVKWTPPKNKLSLGVRLV